MQKEGGDDYVRRISDFIKTHSQALAGAGLNARHAPQNAANAGLSMFGWMSRPETPIAFSTDLHHLFYLLSRFEGELGVDVGPLDVRLPQESISRPLSYISLLAAKDRSDSASVFSFKSISGVSRMSLGGGWWPRAQGQRDIRQEIRAIYSAFTVLPALAVRQSTLEVIAELADDPPVDHVVPLWAFKSLKTLEAVDIDPRLIMGWDTLAESLRSLTLKKSGIEDLTEVFVDAVLEDMARRRGEQVKMQRRRMVHRNTTDSSRRPSWRGGVPPTSPIQEEPGPELNTGETSPTPAPTLPSLKWAFLKHLCLADNALTFFPSNIVPYLVTVTYLDLSSNLLVSVPSGLAQMYSLVTLNLSDNMIESVLGIYTMLGQVLTLNLSRNRIDSLCGLERLVALERLDLRKNAVTDIEEVGRLAVLPNLQGVWIDGNPFVEINQDYRVLAYNQFLKEGKTVVLDGQQATFMERRSLITPAPTSTPAPSGLKSPDTVSSPPVVAVGAGPTSPKPSNPTSPSTPAPAAATATATAPATAATATVNSPTTLHVQAPPRRKRPTKRLVDLDGGGGGGNGGADFDSPSTPRRANRREASTSSAIVVTTAAAAPRTASPPREVPGIEVTTAAATAIETPGRRKSSGHHARGMTMHEGSVSPPTRTPRVRSPTMDQTRGGSNGNNGYATISGTGGRTSKKRTKLSPAMFSPTTEEPDGAEGDDDGGDGGSGRAEAFRAEIEALRASAPENWLKVLSQKQFGATSPSLSTESGLRLGSPGSNNGGRRHLRGATDF